MAIFTSIATFLLAGTFLAGSAIATSLLATGLGIATAIGLNYVAKALAGSKQAPAEQGGINGVQGQIAAAGDVPRSFGVGYHVTAGSLVYANTWGNDGETPNAYLTQVIAVSDLPGQRLINVWVNDEKVLLIPAQGGTYGIPVSEYYKNGHHLWIKYYDGTQTAVDDFLYSTVSSAERPYGSDRIGTGVCYVIATALVEDTLFTGFPTFKFELSGVPLYDPTKDSTNGGSGSQRYSNPASWGGDGDNLPAVQAYNILRGVRYNGAWFYGLQNIGQARLPAANWNAQIAKCRALVQGPGGSEPTYRAGGQINIDSQPANAIEALLTACQGRLSEIGGFYKIYLGAPDSAAFNWTDADLLSSEEQTYRPFFSLADSVNGIQGTYPDPAQGWNSTTAPPLYRSDLEVRDGNRRLMANPSFDFVPYGAQVQRLQKSGLEEAQRARTHVLPFPPSYWVIEPGDIGSWSSTRNGYVNKLFRVDSVSDRANLDVFLNVTEVDPADYSWNHVTDYKGVAIGPTVFPRVPAQGVVDWTATAWILYDSTALARRPAIRITWDNTLSGIVGVQYEVRLASDLSEVARGRTDQYDAGALVISQGLIPVTHYQVRMQYIPSSPRAMLWSDWIDVTTPAVAEADIPGEIRVQVTTVMDYLNDRLAEVEQRFATTQSKLAAQDWEDFKRVRKETKAQTDSAFAEIATVETVAVDASEAVATLETSVTAQFGTTNANVTTNATAIADINGWAAAQYAVTLDVNGYASGFNLVNGGVGFSTATFLTDKFQVASPGVSGGAPVPIFTIANVGGSPKIAIRGDMYADGTISATKIVAGSITANEIATGTITSASGVIGSLGVQSLSIADNAVTVPVAQAYSTTIGNTFTTVAGFNVTIDTTGLSGKAIGLYAIGTLIIDTFGTSNFANFVLNMDSVQVQSAQATNTNFINITLSWNVSLTGTGGVMVIPVNVQASIGAGTKAVTGTLFSIATKR